jgi:type II secretory pathway component PulL
MINLIPYKLKAQYTYSLKNNSLASWILIIAMAIVGLLLISHFSIQKINDQEAKYNQKLSDANQFFSNNNLQKTQKTVQEAKNNIILANKLSSQDFLFSEMLKQITSSIPAGVKLGNLTINRSQGAVDINASAPDYNTATQLQINVSKNPVFSKADIVNITCNVGGSKGSDCNVTVRALFKKPAQQPRSNQGALQ